MSLGRQPIANGFYSLGKPDASFTYHLQPALCDDCGLFQLTETPSPRLLFRDDYPYFSASSSHTSCHLQTWGEELARKLPHKDALIVELGSNDGSLLVGVAAKGIRHLGVDPAQSPCDTARARGVNVMQRMFDAALACEIVRLHGHADVIVAANVLAHIPWLSEVLAGIDALLTRRGIFTFEAIYLADILRNDAMDQLYDEHVCTFSVNAVAAMFRRYRMEIVDLKRHQMQGGTMRYTIARLGCYPVQPCVAETMTEERRDGLLDRRTYLNFSHRCERKRARLRLLLKTLRKTHSPLPGYGAPAKSTTLLNYAELDTSLIAYIVDSTAVKHGKLTPGTGIPIYPPERFRKDNPAFALLLAWNHRSEIDRKEIVYRQNGGKWILPVPEVTID